MRKTWNSLPFITAAILGAVITIVAVIAIRFEEGSTPEKKAEKEPIAFFARKKRAVVFYRFLSKVYDVVNSFFYDETMRETIVNWTGVMEGSLVLDVGCGTGYTTEGILKKLSYGEVVKSASVRRMTGARANSIEYAAQGVNSFPKISKRFFNSIAS